MARLVAGHTDVVSQVYWPLRLAQAQLAREGYLVGYNVHSLVVVVVGVIESKNESEARLRLGSILENAELKDVLGESLGAPNILGTAGVGVGSGVRTAVDATTGLWLQIDQVASSQASSRGARASEIRWLPELRELYCFGLHYAATPQIVFFETDPDFRAIYSLSCPPLYEETDLKLSKRDSSLATSHAPHGAVELLLQPPTAFATPNLDLILTQIHASGLIAYALETSSLNCKSEEVVLPPISRGYLADLADSFFGSYMSALVRLDPLLERILFVLLFLTGQISGKAPPELILYLCQNSATLNLLIEKLLQMRQWPLKWIKLQSLSRKRTIGVSSMSLTWVPLYNAILLIVLDTLVGIIVGVYLARNPTLIVGTIANVYDWLKVSYFESGIDWLMGWPSGVKLNTQLDLFLGQLFQIYLRHWNVLMTLLYSIVPYIIVPGMLLSGFLGFSVIVAVFFDAVSFMTSHVYWLYQATSKATRIQLSGINSLWLLFQGKKRNVLKKRIDNQDYNMDQLLLGTLLFCVLVFLLPTMLIYWTLFVIARVGMLIFRASIEVVLIFIRSFPFVQLVMFCSRHRLFTGGVRFEVWSETVNQGNEKSLAPASSTYLRLRPNPSYSLALMFAELLAKLKSMKL